METGWMDSGEGWTETGWVETGGAGHYGRGGKESGECSQRRGTGPCLPRLAGFWLACHVARRVLRRLSREVLRGAR